MAKQKEAAPKTGERKLTDKQQRFVEEMLKGENVCQTQAAIRAGYPEKSARQIGSDNMTNPYISARIKAMRQKRAEEAEIDAKWVLNRLKSISDRCMQAEPVMVFDPVTKTMVHKEDDEGNKLYVFDSGGANKATEMIGKHIGFFEKDNSQKKDKVTVKIGGKAIGN